MPLKQLIALCLCYFAFYVGLGVLVGIIPIYLTQLGTDSSTTGLFLAFCYLSLAVSNILAGRLAHKLQSRKLLLIGGGLLAIPVTALMSVVTSIPLLMILMAAVLLSTGITLTIASILTGLFSNEDERGRIFGILLLSEGFGLSFGAFATGRIADRWGYPVLFVALAIFYVLIPLAGSFVQDKAVEETTEHHGTNIRLLFSNRVFLFLFVASVIGQASNILIYLSRALIMVDRQFNATAITTGSAIGSLLTLPLPLIVGWLSDRIGRKPVIIVCFLSTPIGLLVLVFAYQEWQFLLASVLQTILGASVVAGSALMADIFPKGDLDTALSWFNATPWIGIVIGLSVGGLAMRQIQTVPTLLAGVVLSVIATVLLLPVTMPRHAKQQ